MKYFFLLLCMVSFGSFVCPPFNREKRMNIVSFGVIDLVHMIVSFLFLFSFFLRGSFLFVGR